MPNARPDQRSRIKSKMLLAPQRESSSCLPPEIKAHGLLVILTSQASGESGFFPSGFVGMSWIEFSLKVHETKG